MVDNRMVTHYFGDDCRPPHEEISPPTLIYARQWKKTPVFSDSVFGDLLVCMVTHLDMRAQEHTHLTSQLGMFNITEGDWLIKEIKSNVCFVLPPIIFDEHFIDHTFEHVT